MRLTPLTGAQPANGSVVPAQFPRRLERRRVEKNDGAVAVSSREEFVVEELPAVVEVGHAGDDDALVRRAARDEVIAIAGAGDAEAIVQAAEPRGRGARQPARHPR